MRTRRRLHNVPLHLTLLAANFSQTYAVPKKGETRLDQIGTEIAAIADVADRERHSLPTAQARCGGIVDLKPVGKRDAINGSGAAPPAPPLAHTPRAPRWPPSRRRSIPAPAATDRHHRLAGL